MKKAKIILDKEDVTILARTSKDEDYYFYNYEIEFENRDISSLPENAY